MWRWIFARDRGRANGSGARLTADNLRALYLPEGVAHGFLTLEHETDVHYLMGRPYVPGHADGVRWDDPSFDIRWPEVPTVLSEKDRSWSDFGERGDLRGEDA